MSRRVNRGRIATAFVVLAGVASSGLPAHADPVMDAVGNGVVIATQHLYLPGDDETSVAATIVQGSDLDFVNGEGLLDSHTLTSVDMVDDADGNELPLFDSGTVNPNNSRLIDTSSLPPGDYTFFCYIHGIRNMRGTLRVVPAP